MDDGDYSITAIAERPGGELMFSAPKQITVRGADVSGVELIVQPMSSVAGRVVLEETKNTECSNEQRPVFSETLVSAQNKGIDTFKLIPRFPRPTVNADEAGNVLLKNLRLVSITLLLSTSPKTGT